MNSSRNLATRSSVYPARLKTDERPKLDLPPSRFEQILEFFSGLGVLAFGLMMLQFWFSLPEKIPTHFGATGEPDGWGSKYMLLALFLLAVVLYIGLTILRRYPHKYNYLWPITAQNAAAHYRLARQLVGFLKCTMVWMFAYIAWQTIQTALGNATGLSLAFLPFVLVLDFGTIIFYLIKASLIR
ncbi:DUF1648 domain-containing protein [bacterium]|nr:DUF1648 domain-containing protein [bacterium]